MATFSGKIKLVVDATLTGANDLGNPAQNVVYTKTINLSNGSGANAAESIWTDTRTLGASASENLDLAGVLTDAFGSTITFNKVKAVVVAAASTNANDVVLGGHATAAWTAPFGDVTDKINVKPGGFFVLTAPNANGLAVTATTADMLTVTNSAGTTGVTYDIIIIGEVA